MKRIVFCDFDGTITAKETFVAVLKEFAPEVSAELMPQMYARTLSLREGVRKILESIPSAHYGEILEFSRNKAICPGFTEFLDFLATKDIPLIIVSGGLRGIVETVLGDLTQRVQAIYAVDVDTSGEYLKVYSEFEADTELVAKVKVIEKYGADENIAIGDSVTDLNMALHTPLVFAKAPLCRYLQEHKKPYIPWDDFFQVRYRLVYLWK